MKNREPDGKNATELILKERDINRLRELILEGGASELNSEPLNASYFEKLRNRVNIQRKDDVILQ